MIWTNVTFCQFSLGANAAIYNVGICYNFAWPSNCTIPTIVLNEFTPISWTQIEKLLEKFFIYLVIW